MSKQKPGTHDEQQWDEFDEPVTPKQEAKEEPQPADPNKGLEHPSYEELEKKLLQSEELAHKNWDKAMRAAAELENIRSRSQRELENAHKYSIEKFAKELLPVIDSLEAALDAVDKTEGNIGENLKQGVELTLKMFSDVMSKFNIEIIDPVGQPFDPEKHEAMSMQPSEQHEPNTVIMVFQKGYQLHQRIIRPARVVVAKA